MSTPPPRVSLLALIAATPAATQFPTLDELKEMLGIPESDDTQDAAIISMMATTVSSVENYLGRGVRELAGVQIFEPVDTRNPKLMLYRRPVAEVRTVTVDGTIVTGWRLLPQSGILEWDYHGFGRHYPRRCARDPIIEVDYTGGFPDDSWPPSLLAAVLRVFSFNWHASGSTGNVVDVSAGGIKSVGVDGLQISYEFPNASASEFSGGPVPPELAGVFALLDPYRERLVTGV
jgi:hypothetical protein